MESSFLKPRKIQARACGSGRRRQDDLVGRTANNAVELVGNCSRNRCPLHPSHQIGEAKAVTAATNSRSAEDDATCLPKRLRMASGTRSASKRMLASGTRAGATVPRIETQEAWLNPGFASGVPSFAAVSPWLRSRARRTSTIRSRSAVRNAPVPGTACD
jgi:hypothetical protein